MPKSPVDLKLPARRDTSVVFASPHSGRHYSWSFLRRVVLDELAIRTSEDAFVDLLFDRVPDYGAPLLCSTAPRSFLDLNRGADELDGALIDGVVKAVSNPRVASGLGVVPRVVSNGRAIYCGKLSLTEAQSRIADYWRPYHDTLHQLLAENRARFGEAILIDCHSMPHEAIDAIGKTGVQRPDVVLGDRYGAAASGEIVDRIEAAFQAVGLRVARNAPFAGAYITQHYGRPSINQHAVQIEIDRALYMNEQEIRPNGNFQSFKRQITLAAADITQIGRKSLPLAAE